MIVRHLEPEWLVSLSLTCKLSLHYIGTEPWKLHEIRSHRSHPRSNFLSSLVRDAPPGLTYCPFCNTLHPPLRLPRLHRATKLTKICMSQWAIIDYIPQVRDPDQEHGYSLLHPHIEQVFHDRATDPASTASLAGHYKTSVHPSLDYELASSASWIAERLVLHHTHTFHPRGRAPLELKHLLALPVRLCPHLSTVTSAPEKGQYVKGHTANSPLLTHALASAFPPRQRTGLPKASVFRDPTASEQKQMDKADADAHAGEPYTWTCRGCTTKFQVKLERGRLQIESFHCFGDVLHVGKYWEWMVRREVANLGAGKRNSEYWFPAGRSIPDFAIG